MDFGVFNKPGQRVLETTGPGAPDIDGWRDALIQGILAATTPWHSMSLPSEAPETTNKHVTWLQGPLLNGAGMLIMMGLNEGLSNFRVHFRYPPGFRGFDDEDRLQMAGKALVVHGRSEPS